MMETMNKLNYINNLLVEGRVDDLKAKYVDTKKVTEGNFKILSNNDPSGNQKYLEWMLKELSKKSSWLVNVTAPYLVRQVTKFHDNLHKIEKKDLYQYGSWKELEDATKKAEETLTKGERKRIEKSGSEKIFENDDYLIVSPRSKEASCHYGMGTRWCTSARNNNAFDEYQEGGVLFYIINKSIKEPKEEDYPDNLETYVDDLRAYQKYGKIAMFVLFDSYEEGMDVFDAWAYQFFDGHDNAIDDNTWTDFITDDSIKQEINDNMVNYYKKEYKDRGADESEPKPFVIPEDSVFKLNYINKLLVEGRVEDAKAKYLSRYLYYEGELHGMVDGGEEGFVSYFNDLVDYISSNDPSGNNKYLDWFFRSWLDEFDTNVQSIKGPTDPYLLLDMIEVYHRNLQRITPQSIQGLNVDDKVKKNPKDINSYDLVSLDVVVEFFQKIEREKEEEKRRKSEVDVVYEDENLLVVHPKSKEASCKYGATTQWCTAATQSDNMFESYSARGGLYYHIWKMDMPGKEDFKKIARFIEFGGSYEEQGEFFIASDSEYSEDEILLRMFDGNRNEVGGLTFKRVYKPFWDSWQNAKIRIDTHYAKNGLHKTPEYIDDDTDEFDDDWEDDDDWQAEPWDD